MKILLDACMSRKTISQIETLGHEVVYAPDVGLADASDQEILEAACASNSVLLTEDHHFHDLKRFGPGSHPGIVILKTKDLPAYAKAKAARDLLEKLHDVDIRGAVVIGGTGGWYNVHPPE